MKNYRTEIKFKTRSSESWRAIRVCVSKLILIRIAAHPRGAYIRREIVLPLIQSLLLTSDIGLDLGIKDLCITSDGRKYENPKTIKKYERKLSRLQRQLAHKEKGSSNYRKKKKELALCHEKITNTRKDYLHKISHEIVSENQVIVSENLQIKNAVIFKKRFRSC